MRKKTFLSTIYPLVDIRRDMFYEGRKNGWIIWSPCSSLPYLQNLEEWTDNIKSAHIFSDIDTAIGVCNTWQYFACPTGISVAEISKEPYPQIQEGELKENALINIFNTWMMWLKMMYLWSTSHFRLLECIIEDTGSLYLYGLIGDVYITFFSDSERRGFIFQVVRPTRGWDAWNFAVVEKPGKESWIDVILPWRLIVV